MYKLRQRRRSWLVGAKLCSSSSSSSSSQILLAGKQSSFHVPAVHLRDYKARDLSAGCGWGTGARLWSMNEAADANQLMQAWLQSRATPHLFEHITLSPSTRYISQTPFLSSAQGSAVETQLCKMGQPSLENVIRRCYSPVAQVKADLMCFFFCLFFHWKCFIKMGQNAT